MDYIQIQLSHKDFKRVLRRYSDYLLSTPEENMLKVKGIDFDPYLSSVEEVCDFLFWFDGTDPVEVYSALAHSSNKMDDAIKIALNHIIKSTVSKQKNE